MTEPRRGVKIRELAQREDVSVRTIHDWIRKGIVEKSALGPRTGVRVRLAGEVQSDEKK